VESLPERAGIKRIIFIMIGLIIFSGIGGSVIKGNDGRNSAAPDQREHARRQVVDGGSYRIAPSDFIKASDMPVLTGEDARGYAEGAVRLRAGDSFEAIVDVPKEGSYWLSFDYYLLSEGLQAAEYSVEVNGGEARAALAPLWRSGVEAFPVDRYGNEVMPNQRRAEEWQTAFLADPDPLNPEPMPVPLREGANTIRVTLTSGEVLGGSVTASEPVEPPPYAEYRARYADAPMIGEPVFIVREAEKPDYKNDTTINPMPSRDPVVSPYATNELLLNTLGGKTWDQTGQTVYYEIEIEQEGLYQLAVKYKQPDKPNSRVFRTFTIDGQVPFAEVRNYAFDYAVDWRTEVLHGEEGPYRFYLSEGIHRIGIMADASPYREAMRLLQDSIRRANELNLNIRKLVGNDVDRYRDWEITDYLPTIREDLLGLAEALEREHADILALNGGNASAIGLTHMRWAADRLKRLAEEPNLIPRRLQQLNGGTGSVAQSLSLAMQDFEAQPIVLDQVFVSAGDAGYPEYHASWVRKFTEGAKRFFHTFVPKRDRADDATTLTVWINRPRNYMDLLQRMTDEEFTPETGIRVNFSTLPNEQRLTLASASGTAPDIALGISNWIPFELGIRGAVLDLRQFEDFGRVIRPFSPGAFLPMTVHDQVFGLPETQDFYVLFYRKDILDSLQIPLPDTWNDVIEILPELQRYGMNFYSPIAGAAGSKPFMVTAPFIYQAGGDLFGKDAFETGIDSEESIAGIQLMTDLFKLYGLPMQVPNFFEHFRNGTLPLGIGNITTYVQMQVAAPELKGAWGIAPAPGVERDGTVVRWQPGSAQVSMIFKDTEHPEEAWTFLKWWSSTETQVRFANQLLTLYGKEYLWNTANTEAFKQAYWPEEDKAVVLEQWAWLKEAPKTPSAYMIERELSNIWNKVVFDGENIQSAVEESVNEIDKETVRKMEEFGYMKNGKPIAPYPVPTIELAESWVDGSDGN
jgi:ABC-type glycerol-3-phosphate transport system substrate-binding protein